MCESLKCKNSTKTRKLAEKKAKKHLIWFDIYLTYEELGFLDREAKKLKLSHMEYLANLLRKEMKKEVSE